METNYRRTHTTVSLINYHFVFCPRYRRKIFLRNDVEIRFKGLMYEICEELNIKIIALECDKDHTHMFLNAPPTLSPADIMAKIKGVTSKKVKGGIFSSSTFAESLDTILFRLHRWKCIERND